MSLYSFLHVISALLPTLLEIRNIWNFDQLKKPHRLSAHLGTWQYVETWIDYYVTPARYMAKIMANWDRLSKRYATTHLFRFSMLYDSQFRTLENSVSILVYLKLL